MDKVLHIDANELDMLLTYPKGIQRQVGLTCSEQQMVVPCIEGARNDCYACYSLLGAVTCICKRTGCICL